MRKLILSIFCIVLIASNSKAQFRIGPELGLNMSNISETGNNTSSGASSVTGLSSSYSNSYGLRVGMIVEYAFNDNLSLQSGLAYSMMGATLAAQSASYSGLNLSIGQSSININYIHIPINIIYKVDAGRGKFFIGGGPYIAYGISGTIKTGAIKLDTLGSLPASSTNISFGSDSSSIKAFDYGINILTGYELANGLLFKIGYSYGFANYSNQSGATDKNTCIFISAGWLFSNGNKKR